MQSEQMNTLIKALVVVFGFRIKKIEEVGEEEENERCWGLNFPIQNSK